MKIVLIIIFVILILGGVGFLLFKQQMGANPQNGITIKDPRTVTVQGEGGQLTTGLDMRLPANFPTDIPQYPGSNVRIVQNDGAKIFTAAWETSDSDITTVNEFYKTNMPKNGWTQTQTFSNQGSTLYYYSKGGKEITITISETKVSDPQPRSLVLTTVVFSKGY